MSTKILKPEVNNNTMSTYKLRKRFITLFFMNFNTFFQPPIIER